jgi:hypothetical protein
MLPAAMEWLGVLADPAAQRGCLRHVGRWRVGASTRHRCCPGRPAVVVASGAARAADRTVCSVEVLEVNVVGKDPDPSRCEDLVVLTDDLVAVVDGVTDKSGSQVPSGSGPVSTGRFAADTVAAALEGLVPGTAAGDAVSSISDVLGRAVLATLGELDPGDRPGASVVVFDAVARVVWRVGDCPFRIDDAVYPARKRIDQVTSDFRAAFLAACGEESGLASDPGRDAILPLLRLQGRLANRPGEFGYGVIDGRPVPEEFITVVPVPGSAREIVLASDGYPTLPATLAAAEAELAELLAADPRFVGPLRSTKGFHPSTCSFDDRAWVRVRLR